MDAKEYVKLAMRTICPQGQPIVERLSDHYNGPSLPQPTALLHGCIGLAGEAGELAEALSKWLNDGAALDRTNLIEELGDCEWYCAEIQYALGQSIMTTPHTTCYLAYSHQQLVVQTGVLMTVIQRWLYYGKGLDVDKVVQAVGHILGYVCEIASRIEVTISEVREKNIAKLRARYPEKFTEELAAEENRNRAAERQVLEQDNPLVHVEGCCDADKLFTVYTIAAPTPVEQNGLGWAEPPIDTEMVEKRVLKLDDPNPYVFRELKRESLKHYPSNRPPLTDSYNRYCSVCNYSPIHKNNSSDVCGDCWNPFCK